MNKLILSIFLLSCFNISKAQLVEVRADYDAIGNCVFSAHNNSKTPIFLNIDFADIENTTFNELLPYVKQLEPGFNSLFTLERDPSAGVPRFNYQIKSFKSNPTADVDLNFPYLIPFALGSKIEAFDVKNLNSFRGSIEPKSWVATGYTCKPGDNVYSMRQGIIVEIAGNKRDSEPQTWYTTWKNSITLLQPDGTLISYKNVIINDKKLNQKIHAGEILGEIVPSTSELIIVIYQNTLRSEDLIFIIPQFATSNNKKVEIINSATTYDVVHPLEIRALEMTKKEKRKILGIK